MKATMYRLGCLLCVLVAVALATSAVAEDTAAATTATVAARGTKKEVVAFVKKAVAYYHANGPDKAFAAFDDPKGPFIDRDLYIYVYDLTGTVLASGANIKLVGKNRIDEQDADGKYVNRERIEAMKAGKNFWISNKWSDPLTHKLLPKLAYCAVVNDPVLHIISICSGVYDVQP